MFIFICQFWGFAVGGAALYGVHQWNDRMFAQWEPDLGHSLATFIYWFIFAVALALIAPFCYAGMEKVAERYYGESISN